MWSEGLIEEISSEESPLLFVDINLGPNRSEWIVVYDGETAEELAERFAAQHGLSDHMQTKLA